MWPVGKHCCHQEDQSPLGASWIGVARGQRVVGALECSNLSLLPDDGIGEFEIARGSFANVGHDRSHEWSCQIEHYPFASVADRHAVMYLAGIAGDDVSAPGLHRSAPTPRSLCAPDDQADAVAVVRVAREGMTRACLNRLDTLERTRTHREGTPIHVLNLT